MEPLLLKLENEAKPDDWYLGYISILDFVLYEVIIQINNNYPEELHKFPKLRTIKERVGRIP